MCACVRARTLSNQSAGPAAGTHANANANTMTACLRCMHVQMCMAWTGASGRAQSRSRVYTMAQTQESYERCATLSVKNLEWICTVRSQLKC